MECYNAVLHFAFSFALVFRNRTLKTDFNTENFCVHLHFDTVNPTSKKSTQKTHWQKYKIFYSQSISKGKNLKCLSPTKKVMTNLDSILKSRDITWPTKVHLVKAMVFSSGHVWMWELDYKESWAVKNWCFWTVVLEKTLESPLDYKEIQPVHPKGDQSWIFIGRTDAEAETPILWPPDAKNWLIWKDPDAGRDWGQEKGTTENEMVGWHHQLKRHEFE